MEQKTSTEFRIEDIKLNQDVNIRARKLDDERVDYLALLLELDPIDIFEVTCEVPEGRSPGLYAVDGGHRIAARLKAGHSTVLGRLVGPGSYKEAQIKACLSNMRHGLPLTPELCRENIRRYWSLTGATYREMERIFGIAKSTIADWINNDGPCPKSGQKEPQEIEEAKITITKIARDFIRWRKLQFAKLPFEKWKREQVEAVVHELTPIVAFRDELIRRLG